MARAGSGSVPRAPCGAPSARRWLELHEERAHQPEGGHRAADQVGLAVGADLTDGGLPDDGHRLHHLDADDHAELRHHLLERAGHPEVALVDGVGDAGGQRRRRAAEADPRQHEGSDDDQVRRAGGDGGQGDHRRHHEGGADHGRGALPHPHGDVARQRPGDREGEGTGDHQPADPRLRIAEHRLEEDRGDDEAAHVGEVGEALRGDRRR